MRKLVTGRQAAEIDRYTIGEIGVPQSVLMERAALAVAEETEKLIRDRRRERILVVAEGGNNGGDGLAAARILRQRGFRAEAVLLDGVSSPSEAYLKQKELAEKAGVNFLPPGTSAGGVRVIIDSIFGVGLSREVKGIQKEAVEWINAAAEQDPELQVLSVDIPTGIASDTGKVLGTAVRADVTVTFGWEKTGIRFAKEYCGKVAVYEIGFFEPPELPGGEYFTCEPEDLYRLLPGRSPDGNKGSFGRVTVIAGSKEICGAAVFAAEAAYRTGCGLVEVITHENNRTAMQQLIPEAILQTWTEETMETEEGVSRILESVRHSASVILGPGLGRTKAAYRMTEAVLRNAKCPVVLDADALNLLSEQEELFRETAGIRPLILTPHMLEAARLRAGSFTVERDAVAGLREERFPVIRKMAEDFGAVVVLKDACTVVAGPEKDDPRIFLNSSGNDGMAKGGSGDLLTGVIAGLAAQGLKAWDAAYLGVFLHGLAGDAASDRRGRYGVIARDILDSLPEVMKGHFPGSE